MKKLICFVLAAVLLISLAACKNNVSEPLSDMSAVTGADSTENISATSAASKADGDSSAQADTAFEQETTAKDSQTAASAVQTTSTAAAQGSTVSTETEQQYEQLIDSGRLAVVSFESYSGAYVEDGSDDAVKDILALRLRNVSGKFLTYASVTCTDKSGTELSFTVSSIPDGAQVLVLEAERAAYSKNGVYSCTDCTCGYADKAEMNLDVLSVTAKQGTLYVTNLSEKKLGTVYVYYKNTAPDGDYLGGITYRTKLVNIEVLHTAEEKTTHFGENSKIIMTGIQ